MGAICGRREGRLIQTSEGRGLLPGKMVSGLSCEGHVNRNYPDSTKDMLTRRREPLVGQLQGKEKVWHSRNCREESRVQAETTTVPRPVAGGASKPRAWSLLSWIRPYPEMLDTP